MLLFLVLNMTILKIISFFQVIEWNKLDSNIRNSESLALFKKHILPFVIPFANSIFQCHNPKGLKLITRLRIGLSHLRFHKFKHNFQDTLNSIFNCGTVETTIYYLFHCPNFLNERLTFFNKLQSIDENILSKGNSNISKVLPYGDHSFNDEKKTSILTASIEYIISTTRFDGSLFQNWHIYLSMCSLSLVFVKKLLVNLFNLVLYFLYL